MQSPIITCICSKIERLRWYKDRGRKETLTKCPWMCPTPYGSHGRRTAAGTSLEEGRGSWPVISPPFPSHAALRFINCRICQLRIARGRSLGRGEYLITLFGLMFFSIVINFYFYSLKRKSVNLIYVFF